MSNRVNKPEYNVDDKIMIRVGLDDMKCGIIRYIVHHNLYGIYVKDLNRWVLVFSSQIFNEF